MWARWLAFFVLCVLSASRWLLPSAPEGSEEAALPLAYGLVSFAALVWVAIHRKGSASETKRPDPDSSELSDGHRRVRVALASCGCIAGPALLLVRASHLAGPGLTTALLALAPVSAVITLRVRDGLSVPAALGPGMLALAGMLVFLPVAEPASSKALCGCLLAAAAAILFGVSSVFAHGELAYRSSSAAVLLASLSNALVFWIVFLFQGGRGELVQSVETGGMPVQVAVEVVLAVLTVSLLRAMPPVAFATRVLWVPLIAATQSYVLLRPPLTWRVLAGAAMIVSGGGLLLRSDCGVPDEVLCRAIPLEGQRGRG